MQQKQVLLVRTKFRNLIKTSLTRSLHPFPLRSDGGGQVADTRTDRHKNLKTKSAKKAISVKCKDHN